MNRQLAALARATALSLFFLAAARPSNAADGLAYVGTQHDGGGVNGLRSAQALALSPDGANLYAAGAGDSALAVFSRNPATGALTFVEEDKQGTVGIEGLGGASAVAVSPDGLHVYAAGTQDDSVAVFSRDGTSGALFFVERERDSVDGVSGLAGVNAVAVSPDGTNVYAAGGTDDAVAVFSRDSATGALIFVELERQATNGVDGLDGVDAVAVSPDGTHVYTAASNANAVAVFDRDPDTGSLAFVH